MTINRLKCSLGSSSGISFKKKKKTLHVDYVNKVKNSYDVVYWGATGSKLYCLLQEAFESLKKTTNH